MRLTFIAGASALLIPLMAQAQEVPSLAASIGRLTSFDGTGSRWPAERHAAYFAILTEINVALTVADDAEVERWFGTAPLRDGKIVLTSPHWVVAVRGDGAFQSGDLLPFEKAALFESSVQAVLDTVGHSPDLLGGCLGRQVFRMQAVVHPSPDTRQMLAAMQGISETLKYGMRAEGQRRIRFANGKDIDTVAARADDLRGQLMALLLAEPGLTPDEIASDALLLSSFDGRRFEPDQVAAAYASLDRDLLADLRSAAELLEQLYADAWRSPEELRAALCPP